MKDRYKISRGYSSVGVPVCQDCDDTRVTNHRDIASYSSEMEFYPDDDAFSTCSSLVKAPVPIDCDGDHDCLTCGCEIEHFGLMIFFEVDGMFGKRELSYVYCSITCAVYDNCHYGVGKEQDDERRSFLKSLYEKVEDRIGSQVTFKSYLNFGVNK